LKILASIACMASKARSPSGITALGAAVLVSLLWTAAWQAGQYDREQAMAATVRANTNLAIAYEENAVGAVADVDNALRLLDIEYRDAGIAIVPMIDGWPLNRDLIHGLAIVDPSGHIVLAMGDAKKTPPDLAEILAYHAAVPSDKLQILRPRRLSSGEWHVIMSRRLGSADGSFQGIAIAAVDPVFFTRFYARASLGKGGLVSLVTLDGVSLARDNGGTASFGEDMRGSTLLKSVQHERNGNFVSKGIRDGIQRITSYRTSEVYPLVTMVATSLDGSLAAAHSRLRASYFTAAAVSVLIALATFVILRSQARSERDLAAIVDAQAKLRESEAHATAVAENIAGGLFTTDFDGRILSVNSPGCRMFGYAAGELVGMHVGQLVHRSCHALLADVIEQVHSHGAGFQALAQEFLAIRKDRTTFEVEVLLSMLTPGVRPVYTSIVHDISARKAMERDAKASEARYRATFDHALVGIAHTDRTGHFLRVNPTLCDLLGYSMPELLSLGCHDILHPDDAGSKACFESLVSGDATSKPQRTTVRFVRKDGSVMWALTAVCAIPKSDGTPDYFLAMIQDITELKRIEEMKSEFVSTVSHELRTPLTSIRGSLGLLAGGVAGALSPAVGELVVMAERNCARLIRLVNDILDTERLDSGKMQFELRVTDVRGLVERAVESLAGFSLGQHVPLRVSAPEVPILCRVDGDRFVQVVINLVSNAVKFSPPQAPVDIALTQGDGATRLEVRDRGPGIPKEFQARIFQRFSQADSSDARQKSGTGLGLCIAKTIVERLGGTIGFRTTPGAGATFFVTLPTIAAIEPAAIHTGITEEATT
jgi:PAS domain S-box-containing protein